MNKFIITAIIAAASLPAMQAQVDLEYQGGVTANAGSGDLAPHYIMANSEGVVTQAKSA